jgi:hypothetical protein
MMPPVKEPLAGLALLVIFGLLIWYNRPIENSPVFDPYVQHKDRSIAGYAYESWLWEDPFGFEPGKQFEDQCKDRLAITNPVKLLAPVLKVRPNTMGSKELRTRQRYAVIAGLIESGYRPLEPNRMRFCSLQNGDKQYNVRWEHYRHKSKDNSDKEERKPGKQEPDNNPDIIVAWMNSEIFTRNDKLVDDAYIFVQENLLKTEGISKNKLYIFDLNDILDQNNKNKNIIKPTADNKVLIEKLTKELTLRNIKDSEVIVIAEEDSESARKQASSFDEVFCKSPFKNPESGTRECEVRKVYYLKGLDGSQRKIDEKNKNEDEVADKQVDHRAVINLHNPSPLPIGPSQLDYFHRLAGQIENPHNDINLAKRDTGIKAVGIFGSDFHDKLLIFEALREEMPNILVFTTDLDAQMLHRQHWRAARNLVVASHFDLLLKEGCQKLFPPFRDSHQTSIFFRTISKVTGHADIPECTSPQINPESTSPQIFEIGRNGFVRLAQDKKEDLNYHPPDKTLEQAKLGLTLLTWILFSLVFFQWMVRPDSGKLSIYLSIITLAIFAIALVFATDEPEPFSFTDGVSLWPTIFIQFIGVLLAFLFFGKARRELDEDFCCLSRRYFAISVDKTVFSGCQTVCGWELRNFDHLSIWPLIILIESFFIYAYNDINPSPSGLPFFSCLGILLFLLILYLFVIETWDFVSIKDWAERDNCKPEKPTQVKTPCRIRNVLHEVWDPFRSKFSLKDESDSSSEPCQESYEEGLWEEYYRYGFIDHRASRVVAIWLFFAIIETILIYLLPPWPLPCRGVIVCDVASGMAVTGFTVVMLLLFFILDAVRLSFYWIQKLRKLHPLLRDKITPEHFAAFAAAKKNSPLKSLENIVNVVAERTRVVDQLIYYAMFCIMLMLFAKITYFDNQDFPLSKGITFAASISLLFFSGFMLRYAAKQLKLSVKKSIENLGKNNNRIQPEVDATIKRIDAIDEGAFQPMLEQPVMQALLIILASVGLLAGDYLKLLG